MAGSSDTKDNIHSEGNNVLMNAGERIKKIEELLEKFQTNHWPHMTGRVARIEGMLAVLVALTMAVAAKTFLG